MPSFVKTERDEELWEKAKEIVQKEYGKTESDGEDYWRLVTGVYKRAGGHVKKSLNKDITLYIDVEKATTKKRITRAEAKAKHPDLPPGGVWRTIKGNHVYILNGQIIAGAGVGKTGKPIKLTKKQIKEHQEHLDKLEAKKKEKEAAKESKKTTTKKTTKKTTTKKATKKASEEKETKKTKKTAAKKTTKKASEEKETKKTKKTAAKKTTKKASEEKETKKTTKKATAKKTTKKATEEKETKKTATKKKTTKKASEEKEAKKTANKKTTKKTATKKEETPVQETPKQEEPKKETPAQEPPKQEDPKEKQIAEIAKQSSDPIDFYLNVQNNDELRRALRDIMKDIEGESTTVKLEKLYKKYGGGSNVPEYKPANPKAMDDFDPGKPEHQPYEVELEKRTDGRDALGTASSGAKIQYHESLLKEPYHTQRYVIAHEVGHVLSNTFPNLAQHIWDNPQDALGRTNLKKGRFEGVGHTTSPEEAWADAFAFYHVEPNYLKEKYPKAYKFVDKVLKKIPNYKQYLDNAFQQLDHLNGFTPDVIEEGTKEAKEHAKEYDEHRSADWYGGLSEKGKKAVDYLVAQMKAEDVKNGEAPKAGSVYRAMAMEKLKEEAKKDSPKPKETTTANEPAPFDPNAPKQKYHRWMSGGYDKRAVSGIPVDLGHGVEGFVHTEGGSSYVYHAYTGSRLGMAYGEDHDGMKNAVDSARAMVDRIHQQKGKEGWEKMVNDFVSRNGHSPRYDENGNVKKGYEKSDAGKRTKEALAKKAEEKYGKFYYNRNGREDGFEHVPGATPVDPIQGLEAFHHIRNGKHIISELRSGMQMGIGSTKEEAIKNAHDNLNAFRERHGHLDGIKRRIEALAQHNPRLKEQEASKPKTSASEPLSNDDIKNIGWHMKQLDPYTSFLGHARKKIGIASWGGTEYGDDPDHFEVEMRFPEYEKKYDSYVGAYVKFDRKGKIKSIRGFGEGHRKHIDAIKAGAEKRFKELWEKAKEAHQSNQIQKSIDATEKSLIIFRSFIQSWQNEWKERG